ncbi:MAG: hypothetical protein HRT89_00335 [Lentisphaeria bacterium]|nr:hypothetical protein [Lentisphaeria bacterium]NQZ66490.1 hypothetical protein [Lentisphaeria bacterium]
MDFRDISEVGTDYSATSVLQRFVAALGFRYYWATHEIDDDDLHARAAGDCMSIQELIDHIDGLVHMSAESLKCDLSENTEPRRKTLENLSTLYEQCETISDLADFAIRGNPLFYMMNGPLSDALTHVGQINMIRRLDGNPVAKVNYFKGQAPE